MIIIHSQIIIFPDSPRTKTADGLRRHFLSKKTARTWNAKLDQWLFNRTRHRKFTMRDSIRADMAAAKAR